MAGAGRGDRLRPRGGLQRRQILVDTAGQVDQPSPFQLVRRVADAFDELGFPIQEDGASLTVPGLFFCGVHFLRKRKSSLLLGMGEDAAIVAERIANARNGR